ncbi:MAG: transglycosylase domain-containing protein [Bacillaceae bacterium]|nr:transglycosylase domain-containing protein [Bacillaceae bacterium]
MEREQNRGRQNGTGKKPNKKRTRFLKWLGNAFIILFVLGLMGVFFVGAAGAGFVASLVKDDPVRSYDEIYDKIFTNYLTGFAYFKDDTLIGQLRAEEDRRLVHLDEISDHLINAVIATEDKYFEEHNGIVPKSIIRAAIQDLTNSPVQTGGSTLTQQLIKNTILTPEVSYKRKAKEIFLALRIERMFSKDQILEAYLNEIYFGKNANGSNIYGIEAAAKGIFDKRASELNLAESAYLAGMPQSPITYSPFTDEGLKEGKKRMKLVLDNMLEQGYITRDQYNEALEYDIKGNLAQPEKRAYARYPFLMMEIEQRAAEALVNQYLKENNQTRADLSDDEYYSLVEEKRKEILRNGYHIHTTIDKRVHEIMNEIATNPENFGPNRTYTVKGKTIENALEEVGSMLIDNDTGAILGMIGGRDFNVEQTNHATAPRQPGSAMKPLAAYGPAFEEGILQPGSVIDDVPVVLPDGTHGRHIPANWNNKFHGLITAREALKRSYNIPAIKAYLEVGIPKALDYVEKMGVTTLVEADYHASTGVIGGLSYGLTVEEITNAYSTFANQGTFVDAYMIERIEDNNGQLIYQHESDPVPVFSEQTAYLMTDMMRTVVSESGATGIGVRNYVGWNVDIAGKTGTTNYDRDSWFVAYTPEVSMGVWIGYDEPYTLPWNSKTNSINIWGKIMQRIFDEYPELSDPNANFERPDGIVTRSICSKSGKLPSELCEEAGYVITEIFNRKFVPTETDDSLQEARVVEIDEERYLAKETTPDDMVEEGIFFKRPEPLVIPENTGKPKSYYLPLDWDQTLPEEEDPREDDGKVPAPPSGFSVTEVEPGKFHFTWQDNTEADIVGYRFYRGLNGENNFKKIGVIKLNDPKEFTEAGAYPGNIYGYYVTAVDVAGNESAPSKMVIVNRTNQPDPGNPWENPFPYPPGDNIPGIPGDDEPDPDQPGEPDQREDVIPSTPEGVSLKQEGDQVTLTWSANPEIENVEQYNIYFTEDLADGFQLIGSTSSTSFTTRAVSKSGWFQITAVNKTGESKPGDPVEWHNSAAQEPEDSQANQD